MKNGKILITGGAGFIGSYLVDTLLHTGWEVTVLDNLTMGNKICPQALPNVQFINGDVRDLNVVLKAAQGADAIIHFAAIVGVDEVINRRSATIEIESIGTYNIVHVAKKMGTQKIIYASSSAVYGKGKADINRENNELHLENAYALAKRLNELYLDALTKEEGISTNSLRFFNVYGQRQDNRMVVPRFFEQAMTNQPIEVFGDGTQTRDFTHVDDVIKVVMSLLENHSVNGIFNVSRGIETQIHELARMIKKVTRSNSEIRLLDFPKKRNAYKVNKRVGCAEKLYQHLDFKPSILLEDGLKKYHAELTQNLRSTIR